MTANNKVQLTGFLGEDPKLRTKGSRSFAILRVATNDSYPVKNGDSTIWKDKETEWHDVFVFRPTALKYVSELKKGNKVEISGSISYQLFKDEKGYNRKQASIIASIVELPEHSKIDQVVTNEIIKDVANSMAA